MVIYSQILLFIITGYLNKARKQEIELSRLHFIDFFPLFMQNKMSSF